MGFQIKPLLGEGQIKLASVFDEAIDWDASSCTMDEFIANPLGCMGQIVPLADKQIIIFRCRAPKEMDMAEVDSTIVRIGEGGEKVIEKKTRRENISLFRRCCEGIDNYFLDDGTKVDVERVPGPDGKLWLSEETTNKIPFIICAEIGQALAASQALTSDSKND